MHDIGGADPQSAFLRAVVVGPSETSPLTIDLDRTMRDAGHDVTLLTGASAISAALENTLRTEVPGPEVQRSGWARSASVRSGSARSGSARSGSAPSGPPWVPAAPAPRAVPLLAWSRLDTWSRTGRRFRGVDVIVLVHSGARSVPALLALLHGAGATGSRHDDGRRPRMVLVAAAPLTCPGGSGRWSWTGRTGRTGRPAWDVRAWLTAALVRRVDAVLVHDDETAAVATDLGADRVRVTARPVGRPQQRVVATPGVMRGSSPGPPTAGNPPPATSGAPASVLSGGRPSSAVGGRTWVTMGAVAREVRRGWAIGRWASAGFTTQVRRQPPLRRLGLERPQTERPRGRRTSGRATTEHAAAGLTGIGADDHGSEPDTALSAEWAHYVGVLESLASPVTSGSRVTGRSDGGDIGAIGDGGDIGAIGDGGDIGGDPGEGRAVVAGRLAARLRAFTTGPRWLVRGLEPLEPLLLRLARRTPRAQVPLQRSDLPDWVMPTDVLVDAADGDEAKVVARELGLPRVRDGAQAWSALGALAAIIRIVDDGHRSAVVVDESGSRSPLTRWARAVGFAPVSLGLGGPQADLAAADLEMETLDVITRVHPGGCDVDDVDEIIGSSSWLLRPGGILVVTLPLGPAEALGSIAPADVRGVVARAHWFGFALVGDLDDELSALMTAAAGTATSADTAYGLVRLTFRRQ